VPSEYQASAWAIAHETNNMLDGKRKYLEGTRGSAGILLFKTREEARVHVDKRHGYLRDRPDLRGEPHGWRKPKVVKVSVLIKEIG
jgi:uncharacterized C2H2 Zn-finger protein